MKDYSFDPKSGPQDELEGATRNLTGKIKEVTAKAFGNPSMKVKAQGEIDQIRGRIQEQVGEIKKILGQLALLPK